MCLGEEWLYSQHSYHISLSCVSFLRNHPQYYCCQHLGELFWASLGHHIIVLWDPRLFLFSTEFWERPYLSLAFITSIISTLGIFVLQFVYLGPIFVVLTIIPPLLDPIWLIVGYIFVLFYSGEGYRIPLAPLNFRLSDNLFLYIEIVESLAYVVCFYSTSFYSPIVLEYLWYCPSKNGVGTASHWETYDISFYSKG